MYFHSRAISGFIVCFAGQIQVKYDNSKLKKTGLRGAYVARGPYVAPSRCSVYRALIRSIDKWNKAIRKYMTK